MGKKCFLVVVLAVFSQLSVFAFTQVAYFDTTITAGSSKESTVNNIPYSAIAKLDILVMAFANDTGSTLPRPNTDQVIYDYARHAKKGAKLFYSMGGENGRAFNLSEVSEIGEYVMDQVEAINQTITLLNEKNKTAAPLISGIDLDLEHCQDAKTISKLAEYFNSHKMLVSCAPQLASSNWPAKVDIANPSGLLITSGETHADDFTPAITSGLIDYVFPQCYNSGYGCIYFTSTVDSSQIDESHVKFCSYAFVALNNKLKALMKNVPPIICGNVANCAAGGGWTMFNKYDEGTKSFTPLPNEEEILKDFYKQLTTPKDPNITPSQGVMVWSMTNDWNTPGLWPDPNATAGQFSNIIFK